MTQVLVKSSSSQPSQGPGLQAGRLPHSHTPILLSQQLSLSQIMQPGIVDKLGQFHLLCPVHTVSLPGVLLASR